MRMPEPLKRSWVLYAAFALFVLVSPNLHKLILNAEMQSLSRFTPLMDYFKELIDKKDGFDPERVRECLYYHQKVIDFAPRYRAEGYAMKGFCYERQGRYGQAIRAFERSAELNSSYFWVYYDLGVLYYHQKDYRQAQKYFEMAVDQDPATAALVDMTSKVYKDVIASDRKGDYNLNQSIKEGYHRSFVFLVLCAEQLKNYPLMLTTALKAAEGDRWHDPAFFYYAGVAAYHLGSFEKSVELLRKYLEGNPISWEAMHYIALSMQGMGQAEMARAFLEKSEAFRSQIGPTLPDYSNIRTQPF